jgi:hypothetical protein
MVYYFLYRNNMHHVHSIYWCSKISIRCLHRWKHVATFHYTVSLESWVVDLKYFFKSCGMQMTAFVPTKGLFCGVSLERPMRIEYCQYTFSCVIFFSCYSPTVVRYINILIYSVQLRASELMFLVVRSVHPHGTLFLVSYPPLQVHW